MAADVLKVRVSARKDKASVRRDRDSVRKARNVPGNSVTANAASPLAANSAQAPAPSSAARARIVAPLRAYKKQSTAGHAPAVFLS
jgi:hypothetical protein